MRIPKLEEGREELRSEKMIERRKGRVLGGLLAKEAEERGRGVGPDIKRGGKGRKEEGQEEVEGNRGGKGVQRKEGGEGREEGKEKEGRKLKEDRDKYEDEKGEDNKREREGRKRRRMKLDEETQKGILGCEESYCRTY